MKSRGNLSSQQQSQYFLYKENKNNPMCNNTFTIRIDGEFSTQAIVNAVQKIIQENEILRTKYSDKNGIPFFEVFDNSVFKIKTFDLENEVDKKTVIEKYIDKAANSPIDISRNFPFKFSVFKIKSNIHILLCVIHHIAIDGWSVDIFLKNLKNNLLHNNEKATDSATYSDYVDYESELKESKSYNKQLNSFKKQLKTSTFKIELPKMSPFKGTASQNYTFLLNSNILRSIKLLCAKEKCTTNTILFSIFFLLLSRYANCDDLTIGTVLSNRMEKRFRNTMGFMANTLPLNMEIDGNMDYEKYLHIFKNNLIFLLKNQQVTLSDIFKSSRDKNNQLLDVLFVMENAQKNVYKSETLKLTLNVKNNNYSLFNIIFQLFEYDDSISINVKYNSDLYTKEMIEKLCENYKVLVENIVNNPNKKVSEYDLISQSERQEIMNQKFKSPVKDKDIFDLFLDVANHNLDKVAVSYLNQKITYGELLDLVKEKIQILDNYNIHENDVVGISVSKSIDTIINIVSLIAIKAVYLPLNDDMPTDFKNKIFEECNVNYVIHNDKIERINNYKAKKPQDGAYIMYTSGSTGNPKGVMITRNAISNFVQCIPIFLKNYRVMFQTGSLAFDAATFEIWGSLLNGLELHIIDNNILLNSEKLKNELAQSGSVLWLTAPLFKQIAKIDPHVFDHIGALVVGGDVVPLKEVKAVLNVNDSIEIYDGYGPTENTTFTTMYKLKKNEQFDIPIGKPLHNTKCFIVNKFGKLQPTNAIGELVLTGESLTNGYINSRYNSGRFFKEKDKLYYKTGDLVYLDDKLNIHFIGRKDSLVKLRGFKVDLKAIESVLEANKHINHVEVEYVSKIDKIILYYTGELSKKEVNILLKEKLPSYMIPNDIYKLDSFKLNMNGKIDKKYLHSLIDEHHEKEQNYEKFENNSKVNDLIKIWSKLLNREHIDVHKSFFEQGGDSIQIIQMIALLKKNGYECSVADVYKSQGILDLCNYLKVRSKDNKNKYPVEGEKKLSPVQKWFEDLSNGNIPNNWNLSFTLEVNNKYSVSEINDAVNSVIQHHNILSSKFIKSNGKYKQVFSKEFCNVVAKEIKVSSLDCDLVQAEKIKLKKSLDIKNGKLINAVIFNLPDGNYVYITIHHLVCDGLSIRIFRDEFYQSLKGQPLDSLEQISYFEWNDKLVDYYSKNGNDELKFWTNVNNSIPAIKVEKNSSESTYIKKVSSPLVHNIFKNGYQKFNLKKDMILLYCLLKTFSKMYKTNQLTVRMEGNGRYFPKLNCDVTENIGWFTNLYPINLTIDNETDDITNILNLKDYYNNIPNSGIGYGVLSREFEEYKDILNKTPLISFNYMGNFEDDTEIEFNGPDFRDKNVKSDTLIDFNIIEHGCNTYLVLKVNNSITDQVNKNVLDEYFQNLSYIDGLFKVQSSRVYSKSDFKNVTLSDNDFENIKSKYDLENISKIYELSNTQKGILIESLKNPNNYFGQIHFKLKKNINIKNFEKAWNIFIEKADILRTSIYLGDEMYQIVHNNIPFQKISFIDYGNDITKEQKDELLEQNLQEDREKCFDLSSPTLSSIKVIKFDSYEEIIINFHHIILDGWSLFNMLKNIFTLYEKLQLRLPISNSKLPSYESYIDYEKDLTNDDLFWKKYLDGFEKNQVWGIRKANSNKSTFNQKQIYLSKCLTNNLKKLAQKNNVSINDVILASLSFMLMKYSNEKDVTFGMTVSDRSPEIDSVDNIIGLLINTLPIREKYVSKLKIKDYLEKVHNNFLNVNGHNALGLVNALRSKEDKTLFDILYVFENYPLDSNLNKYLDFNEISSLEKTNYPLTIIAIPGDQLSFRFSYTDAAVDESILNTFIYGLKNLLLGITKEENIDDLVLLQANDIEKLKHLKESDILNNNSIIKVGPNLCLNVLDQNGKLCPYGIPGKVFIIEDNGNAIDSGHWGFVNMSNKVVIVS